VFPVILLFLILLLVLLRVWPLSNLSSVEVMWPDFDFRGATPVVTCRRRIVILRTSLSVLSIPERGSPRDSTVRLPLGLCCAWSFCMLSPLALIAFSPLPRHLLLELTLHDSFWGVSSPVLWLSLSSLSFSPPFCVLVIARITSSTFNLPQVPRVSLVFGEIIC